MNSTFIIVALALAGIGYAVGHQHGGDQARLEVRRSTTDVVVRDYPYAAACSAMLEAAWDVQTVPPAGLPHNP